MGREEKRFMKLYNSMLDTGELKEVFSSMTGDWDRDKKRFIREQKELEELLNNTNLNLDNIQDSDDFN